MQRILSTRDGGRNPTDPAGFDMETVEEVLEYGG